MATLEVHEAARFNLWLCVVERELSWDRPVRVTTWWPVMRIDKSALDVGMYPLGQELYQAASYIYVDKAGFRYRLVEGNTTKPLLVEEEPIPKPRGKNVTWRNGAWWKDTFQGRKRA